MAHRVLFLLLVCALHPGCGDPPPAPPGPGSTTAYDAEGRLLGPPPPRPAARLNVVVVLIDTLRADAIDPRGVRPDTMPYLGSLARSSVSFANACSPAPWTLPTLMSVFTGRLPQDHGVTGEDLLTPPLGGLASWAEILGAQGYQTAAFVGAVWPLARTGLLQGFQHVEEDFAFQGAAALDPWAAKRDAARPFFLFLHTYEAHEPFGAENHPWPSRPPEGRERARAELAALGPEAPARDVVRRMLLDAASRDAIRRDPRFRTWQTETTRYLWTGLQRDPDPAAAAALRRDLEQAYRAGLSWVDGLLRDLVARLERAGLLKDTLLVITGDHGEAFGEHGMLLHGRTLYDELVRVPLVMRGPKPFDRPRVVEGSVGLTDLLPTVLEMLGLPPPDGGEGRSLRATVEGGPGRPVIAQESRSPFHTAGESTAMVGSVRTATRKVVATYEMKSGTYREEVFDLAADPGETRDLAGPDGLAVGLEGDEAFCRALEHVRRRISGTSERVGFHQQQGYGSGLQRIARDLPPPCAPPQR